MGLIGIPAGFGSSLSELKRCKIVGTIGPASSDPLVMAKLLDAGLNIARVNFSHGDHETHRTNIENLRRVAREKNKIITILQDLQGPKIRCGKLLNGAINIQANQDYVLRFGPEQVEPNIIPVDYRELARDVQVGQKVMMDDGLLLFDIVEINGELVRVKCVEGGVLKSRKGVNFPDSILSLPAMTEKDSRDLLFGISMQVDYIALSFVQTPNDVAQVKKIIKAMGADIPVVAKIEKLSAIRDIEKIAQVSDALMVARGDLGVEGRVERVPMFQRQILKAGAKYSRPVIIATQMLESMIQNPRATLAEVADVANGVLDEADCVMLSGEMASGKYPVECVDKMHRIIGEVEGWMQRKPPRKDADFVIEGEVWEEHEAIARAACEAADSLHASAIVCLTLTGSIARSISRWRPRTPIVAISPRTDVVQRLGLLWGVYGLLNPLFYNTDTLLQDLPEVLKGLNLVRSGETVVITAGIPINQMRPTNTLKINRIP